MKFLPHEYDNVDIMPIKFVYEEGTPYKPDDVLDCVFKVIDTGEKVVHTIKNPKIEVYIVKPEYRTFNHFRDYIKIKHCDVYTVSYKNRHAELAKIMGLDYKDVKYCPYIFGSDLNIDSYYMSYFIQEYGNDRPKELSCGFFDIESDIMGFPAGAKLDYGEPPTNALTYIDEPSMTIWTLLLRNSDNPQIDNFEDNLLEGFKERIKEKYSEYPNISINILFFDKEIELIYAFFDLVKKYDNDIMQAWNIPYDIGNLVERIPRLGYYPESVICDDRFTTKKINFIEDRNPVAHKRRHTLDFSIMPIMVDQMCIHGGLRVAKGKISLKLGKVSETELKDNKVQYQEEANIRTFPYVNFEKFVEYNIHDVILLVKLYQRNKDIYDIYQRTITDAIKPTEAFVTTTMLTNSIRLFGLKDKGYICGNNRQKIFKNKNSNPIMKRFIYMDNDDTSSIEDDEFDSNFGDFMYFGDVEEEDEEGSSSKKKKQYDGAIVSNTNRMEPTGTYVNGVLNSKVHDDCIDQDITSEYPTANLITNQSNETLVGKVFITDMENLEIPQYFTFIDDEEVDYKLKPSVFLTDSIAQDQFTNIGSLYLGLPDTNEVLSLIEENLDKLLK